MNVLNHLVSDDIKSGTTGKGGHVKYADNAATALSGRFYVLSLPVAKGTK